MAELILTEEEKAAALWSNLDDAALALKERELGWQVEKAKVERKRRLSAGMLAQLVAMLDERGIGDVVAEAKKRAEAALSCAG